MDPLPETTNLGFVHLNVSDLDRQIAFHQTVLNMRLHWKEGNSAGLGAGGKDLIRLTKVPGARRSPRTTGLYHWALQYPSRPELARALARLQDIRYPNSPTDHTLSESIYVDDPEGQTIELYVPTFHRGVMSVVDGRPMIRRSDGSIATRPEALDVADLLGARDRTQATDAPLPKESVLGHVNLYTGELAAQMRFLTDVLGFREGPLSHKAGMAEVGLGDRRPHIIAFNVWHGENAPPPPPNSAGLRYFTIELPDDTTLAEVIGRVQGAGVPTEQTSEGLLVRDPGGNGMVLRRQ